MRLPRNSSLMSAGSENGLSTRGERGLRVPCSAPAPVTAAATTSATARPLSACPACPWSRSVSVRSAWPHPVSPRARFSRLWPRGAGAGSSLHAASGSSRRRAAGQRVPRLTGEVQVPVDAPVRAGQVFAGAAPPHGDDLGGDADRGLLGRAGAEVEARSVTRAGRSPSGPGRPRAGGRSGRRGYAASPSRRRTPPRAAAARPRGGGTSNFGSWVRTARTVRSSMRPAACSAREVAVRPVDDDLVGLREAGAGREHRPGVADGHVVAEEGADPRHRRGEVDRPEDQHPRLGREGPHEHPHPLAAPLPVGAVGQRRVVAARQQPERVVPDGVVRARRAERPGRSVRLARTHHDPAAQPGRGRGSMTVARATGRPASMSSAISPSSRRLAVHLLDVHVEDPAAGQPGRERVVVGDAVPLEDRLPGLDHGLRELVDRTLDAAAGHRPDGGAVVPTSMDAPARRRRGLEGRDDGARRRRSRRPSTSPAARAASRTGDHLRQVGVRRERVPGDEVIDVRQGPRARPAAPARSRPCPSAG